MRYVSIFLMFLLVVGTIMAQDKIENVDNRMRPVLVIIDIQNEFLPMVPEREKDVALWMINIFIDMFRRHNYPVIRVHHTDPAGGPKPGTEGFDFPATVPVKPDDPMVVKNFANSFKKTELDKILKDKKCNTVFVCGLSSVGCVLATYFGARDLDYNAFMLKDAVMSHNSTYTDNIEEIVGALSYEAVEIMLQNAVK
jgi:nicotinamidase-related amidase